MQTLRLPTAPVQSQAVFRRGSARSARGGRAAIVVRAAAELPKGVSEPKQVPVQLPPTFGFVYNAERLNSRAAMIGFMGILLVEAVTNKALLRMIGFTVGQGLPFEF